MINSKIKNIFSSSLELYFNNILYITGLYFLVLVISIVFSSIIDNFNNSNPIQNLGFYCSSQLFMAGLSLGFTKIFLLLNKNQPTTIKTLFSSFDLILRYLISSIILSGIMFIIILPGIIMVLISSDISSLLIMLFNSLELTSLTTIGIKALDTSDFLIDNKLLFSLGAIVIIINIIWSALRFQFYQYFIIDEECGSIESLKKSYYMTKDNLNILLQFAFAIVIINLGGILFFGIGIIITVPLSLLCMTKLYLDMKRNIL